MHRLDRRQIVRFGHRVVHQRSGQELAGLVVDHLLEEGAADALRDAAVHLPLDDHGIDDPPAVVGHDVSEQLDAACRGVDLDLGDVNGARIGHGRHVVIGTRLEIG